MVTRADYANKAVTAASTKTEIDELTVPDGVNRIIGIWTNAVMTPTASKTQFGVVSLEGDGVGNVSPLKFPINASDAYAATLTSDAPGKETKFIPVNIPVKPGFKYKIYATMVDATSTNVFVGVIYE